VYLRKNVCRCNSFFKTAPQKGEQLLLGWEIGARLSSLKSSWKFATLLVTPGVQTMAARSIPSPASETREERIEAIMKELRPKIDEAVRQMVERAVDVPEAEEFGAIDFEFRDAGQQLANDVRQASVASRKKRAT
jgi:hypothetical protein